MFKSKKIVPNINISNISASSIFLVEDKFFIDRCVRVTGTVLRGNFFEKKTYTLMHENTTKEIYIANIQVFLATIEMVSAPISCGFLLSNLSSVDEVTPGDIIISNN